MASSIGIRSCWPATVRSATVPAGPVRLALSGVPATVCLTMSLIWLKASYDLGVPNSPATPTGSTQAFLSSLVTIERSGGVLMKSCNITTSRVSLRSASTRLR